LILLGENVYFSIDNGGSCFNFSAMSNHLSPESRKEVISALAEGNSIRSIERMTGIHRDTIMRLGVRVGNGCAAIMDAKMRNLECH